MFLENKIDVATFFSPSSILNFTEMIGSEVLAHTAIAVIGPTTAETAQQLGLTVAILAQQATAEGLVEAIENHVQ
jgi:uroporphyrinogen-III synthase